MGKDQVTVGQQSGGQGNQGSQSNGGKKKVVRKVYDHEMTAEEGYALQQVQRAQSALRIINEAIKSGKTVKADVVKLCQQINIAVGDMLFATP